MDMFHDRITAEREALERSKRHDTPIASVYHTQVYAHVLMTVDMAKVCIDHGQAIASQTFICDRAEGRMDLVMRYDDYMDMMRKQEEDPDFRPAI